MKPGDIVMFRSGGPPMTIYQIRPDGWVDCRWFHNQSGQFLHEAFVPTDLVKCPWWNR